MFLTVLKRGSIKSELMLMTPLKSVFRYVLINHGLILKTPPENVSLDVLQMSMEKIILVNVLKNVLPGVLLLMI